MMMKKLIRSAICVSMIACGTAAADAQDRKPAVAIRPVLVTSKQSLNDVEKKVSTPQPGTDPKQLVVTKVEDLIGGAGMETRVAVQHDTRRSGDQFELHDKSDDVYYVLKGEATLELGGTLDDPKESSPGEWKSKTATGAKTYVIKPGDLVMVPRGTPHRRTVSGKGFSMILIKIFEDPLPR